MVNLINAFRDFLLPLILPIIWYFKRDITESLSGLSLSQDIYAIVAIALIIVLFKNNVISFIREKYFNIKRFDLRSCIKERTIFIIYNDFETVMVSITKFAKSKIVQYFTILIISITLISILDYLPAQLSFDNPAEKLIIYSIIYFILRLLFDTKFFWSFVKDLSRYILLSVSSLYVTAVFSYFYHTNLFDTIPIEVVDYLKLDISNFFDTANRLTFSLVPVYLSIGLFLIIVFVNRKVIEKIFSLLQQILASFV